MLTSESKPAAVFDRSGFDILLKDIKSASQFTRIVIEVFRERAQLESDYAKGLSRLHARLSKAAEALSGTVASAWQRTASSLEAEALIHRKISEELQSQLLPSAKEFSTGLERQLKPVYSEVDVASSRLLSCRRVEWKLRKKAFAAYRLACSSLSTQASCGAQLEARVARAGTMLPPGVGGVGMGGELTPKLAPARPTSGASAESQSETSRTRVVEKSVTLPLPSHCPRDGDHSSSLDSAVILTQTSQRLASQSSLPEKLTKSVWQSVFNHYQSSLASEEARIEWHSVLFQNSSKLYDLERGRLNHLCDTLSSYRATIFDNLRCLNTADQEIQEAVGKVDKAADFAKFCSSLCTKDTKASRPAVTRPISVDLSGSGAVADGVNMKILAPHSQSPESKLAEQQQQPVVGGSKQSLVFLPGEVDSCFSAPPELQKFSVQCMLQKRLLLLPSSGEKNTPESLKDSTLKVEKATFARCMLTVIASLLAREATKEERTKQGLTNLVEIYSGTPTFADESTLAEAKRRLFISRCRLAYVSACRARLACLLSPTDSSHSMSLSSLRQRLISAGFSSSKDLPARMLAVTNEDQTEVQRYASLPLTRWLDVRTPVEAPTKSFEWPPVTIDLCQMECLSDNELRLLNLSATPSCLDTNWVTTATISGNNALPDLQATDTLADLTDSDFESDLEEDQQPGVVPNFLLPNGNPVSQLKVDTESAIQSAPPLPPPPSTPAHTVVSDNTSPTCLSAPVPVEKSRKVRFLRKFKCGQNLRRHPSSPDKSKSPSPQISPQTAFTPAFATGAPEAFMDEDAEEEEERGKIQALAKSSDAAPTGSVVERGCDAEEVNGLSLPPPTQNSRPKTFFGRLGGFRRHIGGANKHPRRPEIVTPWRDEDSAAVAATDTAPGQMEDKGNGPQEALSTDRSGAGPGGAPSYWPSLVSLHCVGWAKVVRDFTPTGDADLPLLEGDIVSIIQKSSADWWIGEAGGKRGRFPVSFIEEF